MKKTLLMLAAGLISMSTKAQITYSPDWPTQNSNFSIPSAGIRYMDVVDPNTVWATGYDGTAGNTNRNFVEFTTTNNGGTSYISGMIFPDTNTYHPASICGIDGMTAWVTSYLNTTGDKGAIHQTTNGGATWTNMTPAFMYSVAGTSFADFTCFFTASVGITVGDPTGGEFEIYRTTNGGTTWIKIAGANIPNPTSGEYGLTDVYTKLGTNDVWFGTNKGRIFHSNDQGQTWSVGTTAGTAGVTDIGFTDANNGIAYAYVSTTFGAYRTTNGGATWTAITPLDPNMGMNDVCGIPGTGMFASAGAGTGNQVISYSTDNGSTWTVWPSTNVQYLTVEFANNMVGYAGGFSDPSINTSLGMFKYMGVPLGIKSGIPVATNLEMYPNPTSGMVTINLLPAKEGAVLTVVDALGKVVRTESIRNISFERYTLNLENLPKGIYSVNITKGGEVATQKIVIQ